MKRGISVAAAAAVALAVCVPLARAKDFPERGRETVQRSLAFPGPGPHRLELDNVFGSIRVAGHDVSTAELTATRITTARSDSDAGEAAREVTLDITQDGSSWRVVVNGPFRENCREGARRDGRKRDYVVRYDFVLKVPRRVAVLLRTVNDGDIRGEGLWGGFDVENVNGEIELIDVSGAGRAHTVNGDVHVVFRENPTAPSSFATLNGDLTVSLRPALSADLRLKTFNGRVYTDYDVAQLPARRPAVERRDGRFVYRSDGAFGVRVGHGGPELSFDSFNGDIRILQGGK